MTLQELLHDQGYRLVEDAWSTRGRITYIYDDDADRDHLAHLARLLGSVGWSKTRDKLRSFTHDATGEEIEIEPGGADVTGHFLHHLDVALSRSGAQEASSNR
jgi:hypothetical protein